MNYLFNVGGDESRPVMLKAAPVFKIKIMRHDKEKSLPNITAFKNSQRLFETSKQLFDLLEQFHDSLGIVPMEQHVKIGEVKAIMWDIHLEAFKKGCQIARS